MAIANVSSSLRSTCLRPIVVVVVVVVVVVLVVVLVVVVVVVVVDDDVVIAVVSLYLSRLLLFHPRDKCMRALARYVLPAN